MGTIIYAGFGTHKMGKQNVVTMLFIPIPVNWFQNSSKAFGFEYKMVLEPTKTDQPEQSYGQMKLTTKIIANQNPRKLFSFFAPMEKWLKLPWFTKVWCPQVGNQFALT